MVCARRLTATRTVKPSGLRNFCRDHPENVTISTSLSKHVRQRISGIVIVPTDGPHHLSFEYPNAFDLLPGVPKWFSGSAFIGMINQTASTRNLQFHIGQVNRSQFLRNFLFSISSVVSDCIFSDYRMIIFLGTMYIGRWYTVSALYRTTAANIYPALLEGPYKDTTALLQTENFVCMLGR